MMRKFMYLVFMTLIFSKSGFAIDGLDIFGLDPSQFFKHDKSYSTLISLDQINNISSNVDELQLKNGSQVFTSKSEVKANCEFKIANEILKVSKLDKIFTLSAHVWYHDGFGNTYGEMFWRLKSKIAAIATDRFNLVAHIVYNEKIDQCALQGNKSVYSFYLYDSFGGTFSDGASVFTATLTNKSSSNPYASGNWGVLKYSINDSIEYTELYHTVEQTP